MRQDELAERYGASRVPDRDALRILEGKGLISSAMNTGAWVSRIGLAECLEIYRIRERLEPLLLALNVPFLSGSDADELELLAEAMEHSSDVERFLRLDREFHLSCLQAARTAFLGTTVVNLWNRTHHCRREATRLFYADQDQSVHHDHHLIVNAIRLGDADEAESVLARHLRRSRRELSRHPEVFV